MDAVVADAHLPNAVAGLRGLGRAGIRATAVGPARAAAGLWSRYSEGRAIGDLAAAAWRGAPVVVYPGQETTIDELLALAPDTAVVLPWDPGSLGALREKRELPALAQCHGLSAPATLYDGPAAGLRSADLPFPAVVKPARPVGELRTACAVHSRAEVEHLAGGLAPGEPVLAQEYARGRLGSLALVLDRDGAVAARFQEEAVRTWPPDAGSFAASVSVEPDEGLVERVVAMLRAAGYWGLAQIDLVRRDGEVLILDVNPRFYACMPLALACGVNLPAAWHALVDARPAGRPGAYPAGRRYRWLEGDVYAARHGRLGALVRPGARAHAGAMWARDDPVASVLLAGAAATRPLRRRLRTGRAR